MKNVEEQIEELKETLENTEKLIVWLENTIFYDDDEELRKELIENRWNAYRSILKEITELQKRTRFI